eukprot:12658237-Prorocentrum_lima.AAC.1
MTSSLVGSEMCIRDRRKVSSRDGGWVGYCVLLRLRCSLRACLMVRSGAVSYTHLTLPTICSV